MSSVDPWAVGVYGSVIGNTSLSLSPHFGSAGLSNSTLAVFDGRTDAMGTALRTSFDRLPFAAEVRSVLQLRSFVNHGIPNKMGAGITN